MRLHPKDEATLRDLIDRMATADKGLRAAEANWQVAKASFLRRYPAPDPADPLATHQWLETRKLRTDLAYWWGCVADYHHELAAISGQITAFIAALEALGYAVPDEATNPRPAPRQVPRAA